MSYIVELLLYIYRPGHKVVIEEAYFIIHSVSQCFFLY